MPKTDIAWGIEDSQLVAPVIYLWRRPGIFTANNLSGAVAHNTEVEVLKRKKYKGVWYVKCRCVVHHEGAEYVQRGWCVSSLLKNKGL